MRTKAFCALLEGRIVSASHRSPSGHALYFRKIQLKEAKPREVRLALGDLVAPGDKDRIFYVDFIGSNVIEVLCAASYRDEVISALTFKDVGMECCHPL